MDGIPENVPGKAAGGGHRLHRGWNYAVVDIGGGRFAFYAHMQPGACASRAGQRVAAGQLLGRSATAATRTRHICTFT